MSEDRRKVLEMLASGKITSEEAERLLGKLESGTGSGEASVPTRTTPKYLRVVVDSSDGDNVNIRLPLALVRTGIKLTTMLPSEASEKIKEQGIDLNHLSELRGEEFLEALRELTVNVDSSKGDTVRVFCE